MKKKVKCENVGACTKANKIFEIDDENQEMICSECGEPLVEVKDTPNNSADIDDEQKKNKKRRILTAIVAAVIVILGGAGFGIWSYLSDVKPEKVILDQEVLELQVGQCVQLVPSVEPADAKVTYTWKSNDETIATVNNGGEVQALQKGETTIVLSIAENNLLEAFCKVIVTEKDSLPPAPTIDTIFVEEIAVSDSVMTLKVGEKRALAYTTIPGKHDEEICSAISDEAIITLSQTGEVVALKPGQATITFTSDKSGKQAKVEVTVKPHNEEGGNTPGKVNLGYGIYNGPHQGAKAHGIGGEVRVTRSYSLDLKKSPAEYVQLNPGDKIVNTKFVNGQLKQGEIHFTSGERRWVNL